MHGMIVRPLAHLMSQPSNRTDHRMYYFQAPDCMDTAREQIRADPVEVSERGDSLRMWMTACLQERQQEMVRHADVVGCGTTGALLLMAIFLTALTGHAVFSRLDHLHGRTDSLSSGYSSLACSAITLCAFNRSAFNRMKPRASS